MLNRIIFILSLIMITSCQVTPQGVLNLTDLSVVKSAQYNALNLDEGEQTKVAWFVDQECIDVIGSQVCFDSNFEKGAFSLRTQTDKLVIKTPWITKQLSSEPMVAYRAFQIDEKRIGVLHTFGFTMLENNKICKTVGYQDENSFRFALNDNGQLLMQNDGSQNWRLYECN